MKKLNIDKVRFVKDFIFNALFVLSFSGVAYAAGDAAGAVVVPTDVIDTLTKITKLLLLVGSAVCIGKIIHIGIMFVTSSAMEKSKAKEAVLPWIIGTIVCFGAATIGGAVVDIFLKAYGGNTPDVLDI